MDLYCLPTVRLTHKPPSRALRSQVFHSRRPASMVLRSKEPAPERRLILPYSDGADGALVMVMPFLKSLYNPFINP